MFRIDWTTPPAATAIHAAIAIHDGVPLIDSEQQERLAPLVAGLSRSDLIRFAEAASADDPPPAELQPLVDAFGGQADELAARVRPLCEQWDARGPGLMRMLDRQAGPIGVARATVALTLPVVGGHGVALPAANAVLFEAVLANPLPELPEVLRLAWLLAQLGADADASRAAGLVSEVLTAAEEVELATADAATIELATEAWRAR